jgi:hypothetical protein
MKYTISIDQKHSIEWGLNLSEATLFSFCHSLTAWAETAIVDGKVWYFASRNKAIEEMPLLTEKPDTIYRLYRALATKGLIEWQKIGLKDYVCLTEKSKIWNSEKFPTHGKESALTRKKIRQDSEKNPTYNNTKDNSTNIERAPAQILVTQYSLETIPAPAKPRTKVSDIQRNPNAYNEAAAYLLTAMKELGATDFPGKFAVPYFLYEMKKSRWVSLILPESPEEHHAWIGTHGAGVRQWAINERKLYPAQTAGTPTTPSYSNYKPKE